MDDIRRTFSYTARKGRFLVAALPFLGLSLVETGVALLVTAFAAHGTLRIALLVGWGALPLVLAGFLARPLRTRHELSANRLALRFGTTRFDLPRGEIVAARAVRVPLTLVQPLRAEVDGRKRRLVAAFSEEGQVLLTLAAPRRVEGRRGGEVVEVLFNVDRREELLDALGESAGTPLGTPPGLRDRAAGGARTRPSSASARRAQTGCAPSSPGPAALPPALVVTGAVRGYGSVRAVDGLDLLVRVGEIYGFLGANGAGKTTTIQMMVGLLAPEAGRISIAGHDVEKEPLAARAAFGYVPDRPLLYDRLTGREQLEFLAQLRRIPRQVAEERIGELLAAVDLTEAADRLCGAYSLGMKRKLSLAAALLHRPEVLILDEPWNGLDPKGARQLKDLLSSLAAAGAAVFLSTHDLATAEAVCHRIGILHRGRLLAEGSAAELRSLGSGAPDLEAAFLELTEESLSEVAV